jgi:hypothetical protein
MTDLKKLKKKTGRGRIFKRPSGALDVYIEKPIGELVTLPINTVVKVVWDPNEKIIIITKESDEEENGEDET